MAAKERVAWVVLRDSTQIIFDQEGGHVRLDSEPGKAKVFVAGRTTAMEVVEIPEEKILEIQLSDRSFDAVGTVILLASIVGGGYATVAAIATGGIK